MRVYVPDEFCHVLRFLRIRYGWSMHRIASLVGYTPGFISKLEGGGRYPTYTGVQKIANAMGLKGKDRELFFLAAGYVPPEERQKRMAELWREVIGKELEEDAHTTTGSGENSGGIVGSSGADR